MEKYTLFISVACLSGFIFSCNSSKYIPRSNDSTPSEYYTTQFPQREVGGKLEQAQNSLARIVTTSFYDTYTFNKKYITLADVKTNNPKDIASDYFSTEESTAGTSIIIRQTRDNILFISCNHVVSSPDTLITYYDEENIPKNTYVKSVSIKNRQNNLIFTSKRLQSFEVIASDANTDLALFTADLGLEQRGGTQSLNIAPGNSENLQLGSFLYILGFPRGYPMITRGLASISQSSHPNYFVTDALFNPGISGGLVLASRDDFQSFEWVGIARSSTASKENILVPRPNLEDTKRAARPYLDTPYVQQKTRITYGITQTIPINTIKKFIAEHQKEIARNGFEYTVDI